MRSVRTSPEAFESLPVGTLLLLLLLLQCQDHQSRLIQSSLPGRFQGHPGMSLPVIAELSRGVWGCIGVQGVVGGGTRSSGESRRCAGVCGAAAAASRLPQNKMPLPAKGACCSSNVSHLEARTSPLSVLNTRSALRPECCCFTLASLRV